MLMWLAGGFAIVVGIVGLILLRVGFFPKRRGDTPYCRKCGYNQTGAPSATCPECGADSQNPPRPWRLGGCLGPR